LSKKSVLLYLSFFFRNRKKPRQGFCMQNSNIKPNLRENRVLSDVNKRQVSDFFSSGKSLKQTDISWVDHEEIHKTELKFKKIMSSKTKSASKSNGVSDKSRSSVGSNSLATMKRSIQKRLGITVFFCEMIGSFLVELLACVAKDSDISFGAVSIAMGVFNFIFQDVSGAHFHPLLTLSRWLVSEDARWLKMIQENKIHKRAIVSSPISGVFLVLSQFIGVLLGTLVAFAIRGTLPKQEPADFVAWVAFLIEFFAFLCIVLVFVSTNRAMYLFRPFFVTMSWYLAGLIANPYSGAVLNPYRWIAVTIFSQNRDWISGWAYLSGPFLATLLGVLFFKTFKL
jgi:glycerol uptake facilitator-like aquaporin